MRRVVILLVLAVLIAAAGGCASGRTGSGVAVSTPVDSGTVKEFKEVTTLTPLGRPSGTLALVLVTNGHSRTLWRANFHSLASKGTCIVTRIPETDSAGETIGTHVRLPGQASQPPGKAVVPRHEYTGSMEMAGGPVTVQSGSGQQVVWMHEFAGGQDDLIQQTALGPISRVVAASKGDFVARFYCLTLRVAGG